MAVEVLCAGVALPTALVRALKLLVEALSAAPSLSRGAMAVTLALAGGTIFVAVASAATGVGAVGGGGGGRLVCRANRGVHLVSELRLDLAQIRRVRSMQRQDLRRHCQRVVRCNVVCRDAGGQCAYVGPGWMLCSLVAERLVCAVARWC